MAPIHRALLGPSFTFELIELHGGTNLSKDACLDMVRVALGFC